MAMTNKRQKNYTKIGFIGAILCSLASQGLWAKGAGTSGGLSLVETTSARISALGEAAAAMSNDVAAFGYNPASLKSLETGQASFLYQKGLAEDAYGQFMIGAPMKHGNMGLSIGYYNGGTINLYDGTTERTVNAQTDMTVSLGYSNNVGPLSFGMTGKYLSSQLIESNRATAYAADLGLSMQASPRVRLGGAVQNIGTQLKFIEEGDNLPRIARGGMAISMMANKQATLLLDAAYHMNEQELRPSAGFEVNFGLLAVRAGFKGGADAQEFSIGTGIMMGQSNLDYSFGMVDGLDAQHRISLGMRFGGGSEPSAIFAKKAVREEIPQAVVAERKERKAAEEKEETASVTREQIENNIGEVAPAETPSVRHSLGSLDSKPRRVARRIYVVKAGDTLRGISERVYGTKSQASAIYSANKHLMDNPGDLAVGQKIILPE
jgi:LysM repeat protein